MSEGLGSLVEFSNSKSVLSMKESMEKAFLSLAVDGFGAPEYRNQDFIRPNLFASSVHS